MFGAAISFVNIVSQMTLIVKRSAALASSTSSMVSPQASLIRAVVSKSIFLYTYVTSPFSSKGEIHPPVFNFSGQKEVTD